MCGNGGSEGLERVYTSDLHDTQVQPFQIRVGSVYRVGARYDGQRPVAGLLDVSVL